MRHFKMQLVDQNGKLISLAGGVVYAAVAGGAAKVSLLTATGAAAANPSALTNGKVEFYVADAVAKVDLYGISPTGHAFVAKGVAPSGPNEIRVDTSRADTILVIPFSATDSTANTETDTGFDVPTNAGVIPMAVGVDVTVLDDTETVDVGTATADSGDPDGFIDGISLATAGAVKASLANGAVTLGALLKVQDSANAGDAVPEASFTSGGKSIVYTTSAGTDTAAGFIKLPLQLHTSYLG